jgi:hypothetical protein
MLSAKDDIIDYIILEENKRKIYHTFRIFSKIQLKLVDLILIFGVLSPLSAIFQLYHDDQF